MLLSLPLRRQMSKNLTNRRHGRATAWQVDFDYCDELSPDQLLWLQKFSDEYYRNGYYYKSNSDPLITHQQAKDRKKANYAASHDLQNIASTNRQILNNQPSPQLNPEQQLILNEVKGRKVKASKKQVKKSGYRKKEVTLPDVSKDNLEAAIKAYSTVIEICKHLTTDNPELAAQVKHAHSVMESVLEVMLADYHKAYGVKENSPKANQEQIIEPAQAL